MKRLESLAELEALPVGSVIAELSEPDAPATACRAADGGWQFLGHPEPQNRYRSRDFWEWDGEAQLYVLHDPRHMRQRRAS